MKHRLLTSILIMTISIAGAGGVIVSAAEVPDTAAVSATEAETTEEIKEAEDKEKVKEDKAAKEKKEAATEGMTSAEEKAGGTQQTPKVKLAEEGQVEYENLYALGKEGVVLQELPPLY